MKGNGRRQRSHRYGFSSITLGRIFNPSSLRTPTALKFPMMLFLVFHFALMRLIYMVWFGIALDVAYEKISMLVPRPNLK